MPELPEVETVRRDLCASVCGARVTRVSVLCEPMLVGCDRERIAESLTGSTLDGISRRGKVLLLRFSTGYSLVVHFRMTGQLYPVPADSELPTHTRTILHLHDGRRLIHVDVRRLGTVELVATDQESQARTLQGIGPDALDTPLRPTELEALLRQRRCPIKVFLLSQEHRSGIGNIYASEILAAAGIDPRTPCRELTSAQVRRVLRAVKRVLEAAVEARGTTISDYRTGTGEAGLFQSKLRVYGREGQRCTRKGCRGIIRRIVQAQRSTFYCPECQEQGGRAPAVP